MKRHGYGTVFNFIAGILIALLAVAVFLDDYIVFFNKKLILQFGLMICGIACIVSFIQNRRGYFRPGWILTQGFVQFFLGLYIFFLPASSFQPELISILVGVWALVTAATQISGGIQLKALEVRRYWLLLVESIVNILWAFFMLLDPLGTYDLFWLLVCVYLVTIGFEIIIESFVRKS